MFGTAPGRFPTLMLITLLASPLPASDAVIRFDLPPTAKALSAGQGDNVVECQLRISSLVASPDSPQIDQWLVVCQPRDDAITIIDYCPRTDAKSDIEGLIEVKTSIESTASMGLSVDGNYGQLARGNVGADKGNKKTNSQRYTYTPPQQAVTASGTINRGRGVYFKLRRSARQVLEGEKVFKLMFQVPDQWRGSLIDVSILAQSERRTLAGLDKQIKTMGRSNFVVAAYRDGDSEAATIARKLADAEQSLRDVAGRQPSRHDMTSLSGILSRVAVKLDLHSAEKDNRWVGRLLAGEADPYLDKEISRLPMDLRLAVLDYCETREDFHQQLAQSPTAGSPDRFASHERSIKDDAN